jgi:hypothetical protein
MEEWRNESSAYGDDDKNRKTTQGINHEVIR